MNFVYPVDNDKLMIHYIKDVKVTKYVMYFFLFVNLSLFNLINQSINHNQHSLFMIWIVRYTIPYLIVSDPNSYKLTPNVRGSVPALDQLVCSCRCNICCQMYVTQAPDPLRMARQACLHYFNVYDVTRIMVSRDIMGSELLCFC